MDRKKCKELRAELETALKALGEKLGLSISVGSGTFTATCLTLKVELAEPGEDGVVMDRAAREWPLVAPYFGLPAWALGKTFVVQGKTFTVKGVNRRARTMPILADGQNGKTYKFSPASVLAALKNAYPGRFSTKNGD